MRRSLPILHASRLVAEPNEAGRGRIARGELSRLARALEETDFATPGAAALAAGLVPLASAAVPGLFLLEETRREPLSWWCRQIGVRGWTSILACRPEDFDAAGALEPKDAPLLTGHGIVVASRGLSGAPLVGMELARVRRELEESRRRLSRAVGYQIRALAPKPTISGRAFDGLVRREAERAGYTLLFEPGDVAAVESPEPAEPLAYRTVQSGEGARDWCDWLVDRPLARSSARIRRFAGTPRAILDRLVPKS